jgi:hypothetical protein
MEMKYAGDENKYAGDGNKHAGDGNKHVSDESKKSHVFSGNNRNRSLFT